MREHQIRTFLDKTAWLNRPIGIAALIILIGVLAAQCQIEMIPPKPFDTTIKPTGTPGIEYREACIERRVYRQIIVNGNGGEYLPHSSLLCDQHMLSIRWGALKDKTTP